jgi:diaminopimelate dehydrogenase
MAEKTRIAIVGYGNVGRGVYEAVQANADMEISGILTRRNTADIRKLLPGNHKDSVLSANSVRSIEALAGRTDVAILCGGSKKDIPQQGPLYAVHFNTVDSFDTHDNISKYFHMMDGVAAYHNNVAVVSAGWDPGTFSINRILAESFLPGTHAKGFYGLEEQGGLSMGHSDALRKVNGVKDARQYTHAIHESIDRIRKGENPILGNGEMHTRECYVVLEKDTPQERARVEQAVVNMEGYFEPYKTSVQFATAKQLRDLDKQRGMAHDGLVIAASTTGDGNNASVEYGNTFESNPEATGNILVASARAAHRLSERGESGARTMADIAPSDYSPFSRQELLDHSM